MVVEVGVLRQVADPPLASAASPTGRPRISAEPDGGKHQLHQQLQRGGLAGAVRAKEAEHLALFDRQGQRVQRNVGARTPEPDRIVLGELLRPNRVHNRGAPAGPLASLAVPFAQQIGDRGVEIRGAQAAHADAVHEERRRALTPSFWPSCASARTCSSTFGYASSKLVTWAICSSPSSRDRGSSTPDAQTARPRARRPCSSRAPAAPPPPPRTQNRGCRRTRIRSRAGSRGSRNWNALGVRRLVLGDDVVIRHVGHAAGRALVVVELHHPHLHAARRAAPPPASAARRATCATRRARAGSSVSIGAAAARVVEACVADRLAREEAHERQRAHQPQRRRDRRPAGWTRRPPRSLPSPFSTARPDGRGRARDEEDADHGDIDRHAQQARLPQHEERGVGVVEDRRQADHRRQEHVAGGASRRLAARHPHAVAGQQQDERRPDGAAGRHGHARSRCRRRSGTPPRS